MPRVPSYGNTQVQTARLPDGRLNVQASPSTFGGNIGKAAAVAGQIVADVERERDQVEVQAAFGQLYNVETSLLDDPQHGAFTKRGRDAFDLPTTVMSDYDAAAGKLAAGLRNDRQRAAFKRLSDVKRGEVQRRVQRHVLGEIARYSFDAGEATIASSRNAAARNAGDPQRVLAELSIQRASRIDQLKRIGASPEVTRLAVEQDASDTHAAVLGAMLAGGHDEQARAWFEQHRDALLPDARARFEATIAEAGFVTRAQRATDDLFDSHDTEKDALAAARKIGDGKLRDEVSRRLKVRFDEERQAQQRLQDSTFTAYYEQVAGQRARVDDLRKLPAWQSLSVAQRDALEGIEARVARGVEPVTDDRTWLELQRYDATDWAMLSDADMLAHYRPRLDDQHWQRAVEMRNAAKVLLAQQASGEKKSEARIVFDERDRITKAMQAHGVLRIGVDLRKLKGADAAAAFRFEQEASKVLEAESARLNRRLHADEADKLLAGVAYRMLNTTIYIDDWFRDTRTTPLRITSDQAKDAYVPWANIPEDDRDYIANRIRAAAADRALTLTDSEIQRRVERAYAHRLLDDDIGYTDIIEGR